MPRSQMKSTSAMKLLSLMAERDNAIQERDMAISQRKAALAELEKVIGERDAAIAERDNAIMERDNVINAFQQTYGFMNKRGRHGSPMQHMDVQSPPRLLADAPYDHVRQMHITEARPISIASTAPKSKWMRKKVIPLKSKSARKKTGFNNDLNISSQTMHSNLKTQNRVGGARATENGTADKYWQGNQDLRFIKMPFDESRIPGPVCSCTGKLHPCYKWGNCGWQSSCCTTTLSMHPLPLLPNKRYSRMGGRKMSGSVFRKLLIRLAAEGHDLSVPVDLKNHWARHGTNAYITIR